MKKNYQQILVDYMMAKREILGEDKHEYFNNDDAIDLLSLSDKKSEIVVKKLKKNLNKELKFRQIYYVFHTEECPFCLLYYNDYNTLHCIECTYGDRHKICDNPTSTWKKLNCGVRATTIGVIKKLIKILKGE